MVEVVVEFEHTKCSTQVLLSTFHAQAEKGVCKPKMAFIRSYPRAAQDLENELARRTHVYQKLIKKMGQRHRQMSGVLCHSIAP